MLQETRQRLVTVVKDRDAALEVARSAENEIAHLRRLIVSLAVMLGEAPEMEAMGITDACRTVMKTANIPLKLRNVCDRLSHAGFDANAQDNLAASVQAVLNRLVDKQEIQREEIDVAGGKKVIVYVGPNVTKAQRRQTIDSIKKGLS
jgi:hypothetical protein